MAPPTTPLDLLLRSTAFDQKTINAMVIAFKDVLFDLPLSESDPRAEIMARKIIEIAKLGERDPVRMREIVVESLRARYWSPERKVPTRLESYHRQRSSGVGG